MADVPHLDLPFRWASNGHAAVVEQDSVDDVAACVEAVVRTRPGQRDEHPNFGSPELVFSQLPINRDAYAAQIAQWEPRVNLLVEEDPDLLDATLTRLRLRVEA